MTTLKIFIAFLIIKNLNGNVLRCDLRDGGRGFCVLAKDCAITRSSNFVFYPDHFCPGDFLLICCDPTASTTEAGCKNTIVASSIQSFEEHPNYRLLDLEKCGELSVGRRVSHGSYAAVLEFPWTALIGYKIQDDVNFLCGGTLISDNYVITASHCLISKNKQLKNALGEHTKSTTRDCYEEDAEEVYCADPVQDISIDSSDFIIHSEFSYSTMKNDIALIRLKETARINQNNIKPICLPFDSVKNHRKLTVIGFGSTETSGRVNSDVLMKVNVNLKKNEDCSTQLKLRDIQNLDETQMCAGDSRDSCEGDSGSSLEGHDKVGQNKMSKKILYGIVSFGSKCGSSEPGVYTKIQSYLYWILDNVRQI